MKEEREIVPFKDQTVGFKVFIAILCMTWLMTAVMAVGTLKYMDPFRLAQLVLGLVLTLVGIGGYLTNRRYLSLIFLYPFFIMTLYKGIMIVQSFITMLEYYTINELSGFIVGSVTGIALRFLLCYFAYRFLPSKEGVQ